MVERVEILVEEPSMEAALRALLPAWLGAVDFEVFPYQGKEDLLSKLPSRLRGYSRFLPENWRIIVLVDRDDQECTALKNELDRAARAAGLRTRSNYGDDYQVANRIVIEELEAWYFGDWNAVLRAYPKIAKNIPNRAGFRYPDLIAGGTWEAFERIAQSAGYFKGGLRKIEAAARIGAAMVPEENTSPSFHVFRQVIDEMSVQAV
jgi:hypothetical protein